MSPLSKDPLPATILSQRYHVVPGQLLVCELFFEVLRDHDNHLGPKIQLFGRSVTKYERPIVPLSESEVQQASTKPFMVFLEGGPGFGNREPQESTLTRVALSRGYQVLFLDYRGTGLSTPVTAASVTRLGGVEAEQQLAFLKLFRQDNIVRDLEAVRQCLTADFPPERKTWSIFGQSFGGFVSLTYLSFFPQGLREVFLTGGLAPIGRAAEEVYSATFHKILERNVAYYDKFPEDIKSVHQIARFIQAHGNKLELPGGGYLSVPRFLTVGISFGGHGGLDNVHSLILKLKADLDQLGFLTRSSLTALEQYVPFDCNVIYAVLHEAIYCYRPGIASNWAAFRVGQTLPQFSWLSERAIPEATLDDQTPLYFSGEMIFPLHFETHPELQVLQPVAQLLAKCDTWSQLYDEDQLSHNEVPVYAASFVDDMYVDFDFARETATKIHGIKLYETNAMYHNAIRARSDEVLRELFRLRDDCID